MDCFGNKFSIWGFRVTEELVAEQRFSSSSAPCRVWMCSHGLARPGSPGAGEGLSRIPAGISLLQDVLQAHSKAVLDALVCWKEQRQPWGDCSRANPLSVIRIQPAQEQSSECCCCPAGFCWAQLPRGMWQFFKKRAAGDCSSPDVESRGVLWQHRLIPTYKWVKWAFVFPKLP